MSFIRRLPAFSFVFFLSYFTACGVMSPLLQTRDPHFSLATSHSFSISQYPALANLSMSKLTGHIAPSFTQLTELEFLDLSGNDLSGSIPEFLAELSKLRVLDLRGNKLAGPIPKSLKDKSDLKMSFDDNPDIYLRDSCKRHMPFIVLIASLSALTVAILFSLGIRIFSMKQLKAGGFTREESLKPRNQEFSYSNILEITNNFQNLIGEGGFGKVYLGNLKNDTQVAVKLISHASSQSHREFRSEVELLMVVHHRNLVSLIGYCEENGTAALVFEYMANGDLRRHLSGNNRDAQKWKNRLHFALASAHGLDYLHNGCKPPIVHSDLKTANILLDKNMEAKIADFGLSKAFANDIDTHVSTRPAGTVGYLDPEFHKTGNLTKGSDIYSFGIILLELITGKRAAIRQPDDNSFSLLLHWITPKFQSKDIKSIVDPKFQGQYNVDSAWKFLEIAMSCTAPSAIQRPDINQVVVELRECLAMETNMERTTYNPNSDISTLSGR